MTRRLRHALRFALPTVVVVYLLGAAWIAVDVFVLGDGDPAIGAARTFSFDEQQWRLIAVVLGGVVFLWKLGDMSRSEPSWRYTTLFALWFAIATIAVAIAMTVRDGVLAAVLVATAVVTWLFYRRRVAGRPGAIPRGAARRDGAEQVGDGDLR